jgi:hypothetical protein
MIREDLAAPSREGRRGQAGPGKKIDMAVKFFLDNRGGKLYPPRFIKKGPTQGG